MKDRYHRDHGGTTNRAVIGLCLADASTGIRVDNGFCFPSRLVAVSSESGTSLHACVPDASGWALRASVSGAPAIPSILAWP